MDIQNLSREEKIVMFMHQPNYVPLLFDELASVLCVADEDMGEFARILSVLISKGQVMVTKKKRYATPESLGFITGKFRGNDRGFGFVLVDDGDVFIPAEHTFGAMNGDTVMAQVTSGLTQGKRREGRIVKVTERANVTVVGTFEKSRNFGFVIPDDKRISQDIFVSKGDVNGAKDGDKVVVKITKWGDARRNPEGSICEIIGAWDEKGVDVMSVMKRYGINDVFPKKVLDECDRIEDRFTDDDLSGRCDFRDKIIFTIDGADAKDLDDAVSIEKSGDEYILGVHIADVSHYVTESSHLDKEALKRGTSVYFADRVVPMLPKKLSNGVCSLHPNVDRLTLSVIMNINENGDVVSHQIVESIINSCERMTYDDVTKIIEESDSELTKRYEKILPSISLMHELSGILKKKRNAKGSIDFDFPETKIVLDEGGFPIDIYRYKTGVSNGIIEEFMLVCNQTVAEYMYWTEIPFVYRIHEKPSLEKITAFNEFAGNLGYKISGGEDIHPMEFAKLLNKIKGTREERIVSTVMLRSLMKARYDSENQGHFGLAFKYYCHFTSPIRRYPDLIIHRIIKEFVKNGQLSDERITKLKSIVATASYLSSEAEVNAQDAEREVEDIKKAEYMLDKVGEEFTGIISSVTSFGFFVELDNTVEGLVRVADLDDDYYIYDEKHFTLTGERTKRTFKIGDEVSVVVGRVDAEYKEVDFILMT